MPSLKRTTWPSAGLKRKKATLASTTVAKPRAAVRSTPQRATLAAQTTAPPPSVAPGPSSRGEAARSNAMTGYHLQVGDINRQLLQAALNYGGVGSARNFNPSTGQWEDIAVNANDPLSSVAQVARTQKENTTGLENELTSNNTFFSGMHLNRQQDINDLADRDRAQAERDYQNAVNQLLGMQGQAGVDYTSAVNAANQADIDYAASQEPTPGVQNPVAAAPVAIRIPTSQKYPLMQKSGPNAGIAYQITTIRGKRYRMYADGRPPVPA